MNPEERDALAAEYVLGTLNAAEARAVRDDPSMAEAVAAWEARLAPLHALAVPEAPPPDLWSRIEESLVGAPKPVPAVPARAGWFTRFWAMGATGLAAALAVVLVLQRPTPAPLMTVLLTSREAPAFLVEADRGGEIRLAALNNQSVPEGRVRELWALPPGATAPTSLGLVPADGRINVRPAQIRPEPGMLIEITLEPPGGSPIGRPTGPVLFIGRLFPARGA
jgi:anti-sigma-K factor RskA